MILRISSEYRSKHRINWIIEPNIELRISSEYLLKFRINRIIEPNIELRISRGYRSKFRINRKIEPNIELQISSGEKVVKGILHWAVRFRVRLNLYKLCILFQDFAWKPFVLSESNWKYLDYIDFLAFFSLSNEIGFWIVLAKTKLSGFKKVNIETLLPY